MKSKTTAALLAFFLGGFGVHKFYLGKTGWGIAYALFFWTIIPAIVAFIEFIMLLVMSDQEFNNKYNGGNEGFSGVSNVEKLEKLAALRQKNMITEAEYELQKQQLLSKI